MYVQLGMLLIYLNYKIYIFSPSIKRITLITLNNTL